MAGERILLVDDDPDILEVLQLYMEKEGYEILTVSDGSAALKMVAEFKPDLIILDVMLPGMDGYEVCANIRKMTDVPILFLSAKHSDVNQIIGLTIGGDDFITKPYNPSILVAKVKAHLRRNRIQNEPQKNHNDKILSFPGLKIDLESCTVQVDGETITLPAKEFQLLAYLAQHPNKVFSVEQLFDQIWGEYGSSDFRTVMVHISNIRKKIEKDPNRPKYIKTIRGIGYKFTNV